MHSLAKRSRALTYASRKMTNNDPLCKTAFEVFLAAIVHRFRKLRGISGELSFRSDVAEAGSDCCCKSYYSFTISDCWDFSIRFLVL